MDIKHQVVRAQAGEESAFDELYRSLYTPLFRFVLMRIKNRDEAEDITQEAFIKFVRALPNLDAEKSVLSYLLVIARNCVIDHTRRARPALSEDELWESASSEPSPEESAHLGLEVSRVLSALCRLSPVEEMAIQLKYLDGLETQEVAAVLGKSDEALRQILSRGLKSLRTLL